jgi:hypothetical protein
MNMLQVHRCLKATIHFENGKSLTIDKNGAGTYVHGMSDNREAPTMETNDLIYKSRLHIKNNGRRQWIFDMSTEPSYMGSAILKPT